MHYYICTFKLANSEESRWLRTCGSPVEDYGDGLPVSEQDDRVL